MFYSVPLPHFLKWLKMSTIGPLLLLALGYQTFKVLKLLAQTYRDVSLHWEKINTRIPHLGPAALSKRGDDSKQPLGPRRAPPPWQGHSHLLHSLPIGLHLATALWLCAQWTPHLWRQQEVLGRTDPSVLSHLSRQCRQLPSSTPADTC